MQLLVLQDLQHRNHRIRDREAGAPADARSSESLGGHVQH